LLNDCAKYQAPNPPESVNSNFGHKAETAIKRTPRERQLKMRDRDRAAGMRS
jgi:hypothetical protein